MKCNWLVRWLEHARLGLGTTQHMPAPTERRVYMPGDVRRKHAFTQTPRPSSHKRAKAMHAIDAVAYEAQQPFRRHTHVHMRAHARACRCVCMCVCASAPKAFFHYSFAIYFDPSLITLVYMPLISTFLFGPEPLRSVCL